MFTVMGNCGLPWGLFVTLSWPIVTELAAFGSVSCPGAGHCFFFVKNSPVLLKLEKAVELREEVG